MTELRDVLAPHIDSGAIPGLAALVTDGDGVQVEALGTLHVDGPPVQRDSIFRISSLTKPVVAAVALLLVEDKAIALDEPVDRLLPELADRRVLTRVDAELDDTVPAARSITVRDLLTFRLGIGLFVVPAPLQRAMDALSLAQGAPGEQVAPAPDEWLRRLGTLPLAHQPGERWMYSTGSDVLGVLLARASGTSLPDLLAERIFAPLGMRDTGFHVPARSIDRFATLYDPDLRVLDDPATGQWSREPAFPSGAGGLVSTVDDLHAFSEMLRGDGTDLLTPDTVAQMTTDQLLPGQADGIFLSGGEGWGFGLSTGPTPGRYGWDGGLGSSWYCGPRTSGVLLTQVAWTMGPTAVRGDFLESL